MKNVIITGAANGVGKAVAKVDGKIACVAELTFAIQ